MVVWWWFACVGVGVCWLGFVGSFLLRGVWGCSVGGLGMVVCFCVCVFVVFGALCGLSVGWVVVFFLILSFFRFGCVCVCVAFVGVFFFCVGLFGGSVFLLEDVSIFNLTGFLAWVCGGVFGGWGGFGVGLVGGVFFLVVTWCGVCRVSFVSGFACTCLDSCGV